MATSLQMAPAVRFHLSLNVADLGRSVGFFRMLFDREPAKQRPDYAKFELDEPPLVLSLEPSAPAGAGALNHLGFRLNDVPALVALQERLERAGLRTRREEGVECCYARQTKFWVHDPDGNLWEMYTLDEDIDHRGAGQSAEVVLPTAPSAVERLTWEHRMNEPAPTRIPLADRSADEIRLRGTLNLPLAAEKQRAVVAEALRVLRPGGRLFVHVLVGEQAVESPELPGPAGAVRSVPFEADPAALLEEAGFVGVSMLKFDAKPCFVPNGVAMRELQLEGFAPSAAGDPEVEVIYKGPFRAIHDDAGRVFPRGRRVAVPRDVATRLGTPELSAQFTVLPAAVPVATAASS